MGRKRHPPITQEELPPGSLWTVVRPVAVPVADESRSLCRCKCGTERIIPDYRLRKGMTLGCHACRVHSREHGEIGYGGGRGNRKPQTLEIWAMLRSGARQKEIAKKFGISVKRVSRLKREMVNKEKCGLLEEAKVILEGLQ